MGNDNLGNDNLGFVLMCWLYNYRQTDSESQIRPALRFKEYPCRYQTKNRHRRFGVDAQLQTDRGRKKLYDFR